MRVARSVLVAVLLLTAAACSGSDDGGTPGKTSASSSSDPVPQADDTTGPTAGKAELPKKNECWNIPADELDEGTAPVSTKQKPVNCAEKDSAQTLAVIGIPTIELGKVAALAETGQAIDPEHEKIWRSVVTPLCADQQTKAFTSRTVAVDTAGVAVAYKASTVQVQPWLPTAEQWADGARWVRCDLVNVTGTALKGGPQAALKDKSDDIAECLVVGEEGALPVPCGDPLMNAQALVTVVLDDAATQAAQQGYDAFQKDQAPGICADAVKKAYPSVTEPGKAATPIAFAFHGHFDCYVERKPGDPVIK